MSGRLLTILAVAFCVRLVCYAGFTGLPDEQRNAEIIHQVVTGTWPTLEESMVAIAFTVRIAFLGVQAGLVKLLGFSEFSLILYPLLASLLTTLLVYLLGRRWMGETESLLAALLFAVFPLDIVFSTRVYVDVPLNFLCVLSTFLFFLSYGNPHHRWRDPIAFCSGLVVGLAYLHKVTAGYFCLLFALIGLVEMARQRKILWRYGFLLLGFLVVFGFEMVFQYRVNQDPLYSWKVYSVQADSDALREALYAEEAGGLAGALRRLFWTFPLGSLLSLRLGFFYWFIFPAFLYCLFRRRRELWAPLLWWTLVAVLSNLSTWQGLRLPFYARQTLLISVPGVILLARMLADLQASTRFRHPRQRLAVLGLFGLLGLVAAIGLAGILLFQGPLLASVARTFQVKSIPFPLEMLEMLLGMFLPFIRFAALSLVLFFGALFLTGWLRERRGETQWASPLLTAGIVGFLAITSVSLACAANRAVPNLERDAFQVLRALPPKTIYADTKTRGMLRFYFGYTEDDRLVNFTGLPLDAVRDGYLVYNSLYQGVRSKFPDFFSRHAPFSPSYPPLPSPSVHGWELIASIHDGNVLIYRIP